MSVRDAITVIGTAVGAYFGNPQLGYAIGSAIGNAVDPEVIKGPSIGDIARQTSMEGIPRPIVFALSQPMAGNIIASGEPDIVRKRQRQGKGGPKVETESVYRTYAIGVCEGPIHRFVRVWRNNMLVYDTSENPLLTVGDNNKFLQNARFFYGSFTQNASPDLESKFGVGTTPSHRGTAYMVMANEDLTDLRGAIPQYVFQVERCEGTYLTSRPYPANDINAIDVDFSMNSKLQPNLREAVNLGFSFVGGDLNEVVLPPYQDGEPEAIEVTGFEFVGGFTNETIFSEYEDGDPEAVEITSFEFVSGELNVILIGYEDGLPEAVQITGFSFVSGTLS
jgi:hypothetical protein